MKNKIISFFKKNPSQSFRSKDVAKQLGIFEEYEYSQLKAVLFKLSEEGFLLKQGKRYKVNRTPLVNIVTGVLHVNQAGYGFVVLKKNDIDDIFIAERNLGTAFSGDTVEVSLFAKQKGKNIEGQIINVIKRKREKIVGELYKSHSVYYIKPDENDIHRDIYINDNDIKTAKRGDKVIVGNIIWDDPRHNPEGDILEVLGSAINLDAQMASIAAEFNLPYKFGKKVLAETEEIPFAITEDEIKKRIDFRDKNVFTIDPEDAKDFDDALSIEEIDADTYRIGIHIADVSHYVNYKTNLDDEALNRGNSVYLVGRVIPMLPEKLSNIICSLVPNEDRLTYSVILEITKRGKLIDYTISKTIINSKRRFSYEEAQEVLDSGKGDFVRELTLLNNLAQILRKKRMREGSIDFFTPEIKFELDEDGRPIAVKKKEIKESNMLIEEYMLMANKLVAKHIFSPKKKDVKPFIYRIHDLPVKEKLVEFSKFVKTLGYHFDPNAPSKSNQFQLLLQAVKGTEEETIISELAIRSMAKAVYDTKNIGHYGLGFKHYTHFTSPIRRYSDLIVHRLLYLYLNENNSYTYTEKHLESICEHLSITERSAVDAERLSVKLKQIEFLKDKIGYEFHAVISGIVFFGIFIKLVDVFAEGLVRLKDIESDFYVYDEKKHSIIGRSTKKQFRLGDKVNVKLIRVDTVKSELDFLIIE